MDNVVAVAACNELCNKLGLDTISTGATISWAVECFERGLLTREDTGGIDFQWNDPENNYCMIEMIAARQGFGDLLAEGSRAAARRIGRGSERYAIQVKGQELPNHEPRGKWGVGLGYAVSPTGGDHLQAAHDPWFIKPGKYATEYDWVDLEDLAPIGLFDPVPAEDLSGAKVRLFVYLQYIWALHDVLDWCIFTAVPEFRALSLNQLTEIVACSTGWRTSLFEVLKVGERSVTMARSLQRDAWLQRHRRYPSRALLRADAGGRAQGPQDRQGGFRARTQTVLRHDGLGPAGPANRGKIGRVGGRLDLGLPERSHSNRSLMPCW